MTSQPMNDAASRPRYPAEWHARRAEELLSLARSASMAGWWQRGRRRDLLAAAQVHATLGSKAVICHPETI